MKIQHIRSLVNDSDLLNQGKVYACVYSLLYKNMTGKECSNK